MAQTIAKAISRPGVAPAFFAALGVFVLLLVIQFLQAVFSTLSLLTQSLAGDFLGQLWFAQLSSSVSGPLPFAIGVFLCFWQIAPVASMLRLAHVVTRSILASAVGAAVMFVVLMISLVVVEITKGPYHGGEFLAQLGPHALVSLFGSLSMTAGYLPAVVLSGILLWGWLQRHPTGTSVHGALDEV